jgi:hypothetical protein
MRRSRLCALTALGLCVVAACPGFADDMFQSAPGPASVEPPKPHRSATPAEPVEPRLPSPVSAPAVTPPVSAGNRVLGFTWMYKFQPEPGLRAWSNIAADAWTERYPSGQSSTFHVRSRMTVDGCLGTLVFRDIETNFEVFIPDGGCPHMVARFRRDQGSWNLLGEMRDITYASGR